MDDAEVDGGGSRASGRELTSADVKYTIERFLTLKGTPSAYMLRTVERVETPDAYR